MFKTRNAGCVLRFKRKRKIANAKIYEDKGATIRLPGGGPGFFSLARIFFSVTFRAKIFFFKLSWARIFFSQAILGQNIFFYTIQIWKQLFSWAANRLQNYYIEVVCCLSVCVSDRDDFKWHNFIGGFIPLSKFSTVVVWQKIGQSTHIVEVPSAQKLTTNARSE